MTTSTRRAMTRRRTQGGGVGGQPGGGEGYEGVGVGHEEGGVSHEGLDDL